MLHSEASIRSCANTSMAAVLRACPGLRNAALLSFVGVLSSLPDDAPSALQARNALLRCYFTVNHFVSAMACAMSPCYSSFKCAASDC